MLLRRGYLPDLEGSVKTGQGACPPLGVLSCARGGGTNRRDAAL